MIMQRVLECERERDHLRISSSGHHLPPKKKKKKNNQTNKQQKQKEVAGWVGLGSVG